MPPVNIPNATEIRDIVVNELLKREKLISKGQIKILIREEIKKQNTTPYKQLDKLRKRVEKLEEELRIRMLGI